MFVHKISIAYQEFDWGFSELSMFLGSFPFSEGPYYREIAWLLTWLCCSFSLCFLGQKHLFLCPYLRNQSFLLCSCWKLYISLHSSIFINSTLGIGLPLWSRTIHQMALTNFILTVAGVSAVILLMRSDVRQSAAIFRRNVRHIRHWLEEESASAAKYFFSLFLWYFQ